MLKYATALAALIALPGCGSGGTAEKQTSDTGAAAVASDVAPPTIAGATGIGISTADLPPFVELPTGTMRGIPSSTCQVSKSECQ